jgi:hypothetical protein
MHEAEQLSNPTQAFVTLEEIITVPNEEVKQTPCFMLSTSTKLKSARTGHTRNYTKTLLEKSSVR